MHVILIPECSAYPVLYRFKFSYNCEVWGSCSGLCEDGTVQFAGRIFYHESGGSKFLRNVSSCLLNYPALARHIIEISFPAWEDPIDIRRASVRMVLVLTLRTWHLQGCQKNRVAQWNTNARLYGATSSPNLTPQPVRNKLAMFLAVWLLRAGKVTGQIPCWFSVTLPEFPHSPRSPEADIQRGA
jgi:hypothetical protein